MPDVPLFSDPDLREAGAVRLRRVRDAGAVVGDTLRLVRDEAGPLLGALYAIVGPMVVLSALVRVVLGGTGTVGGTGVLTGSLVDAAANLLATASALAYVRLYVRGAPRTVADVWDETKPLLGPLLAYVAVLFVGLIALAIPVGILLAALASLSAPLAVVVAVVAGLAALLVGVPFVSLALVAIGLDELPVGTAFARARALIGERTGLAATTTVIVMGLAFFAAIVLVGTLGQLVVPDPEAGMSAAAAVATAAASLVMLPLGAVVTLVWVLLYGSLVEATEGASLGTDLDALAGVLDDAERDAPSGQPDRLGAADAEGRDASPARSDDPGDRRPGGGFRGGGFPDPEA